VGASSADAAPLVLRDIVVIGGGCYGGFYAGQLARARAAGRLRCRRVLVVDRDPACAAARRPAAGQELVVADWAGFLAAFLGGDAGDGDAIVPSPLMPHLFHDWLVSRARAHHPAADVRAVPCAWPLGTPYDRLGGDGVRYVSFADWLCPVHCIEPARCPVTRGLRTWEMEEAVRDLVRRRRREAAVAGPAIFACRHAVHGVGMVAVAALREADRLVRELDPGPDGCTVVVASVSSCHGAIGTFTVTPGTGAGAAYIAGRPPAGAAGEGRGTHHGTG